ncbi:MAG: ChbG/HpnK family deacetylase, partial [Crocinitomicaceae bacterium]|nr:ChbG/HpnK family deacetylase [Crocinitomicaceae bacterium]
MSFKLIVNADDFGPIDFINQGVYHHLSQGNIDSTQVLVNMDPAKLKANLKRLYGYVPADRTFDLGVHFTLTSGGPLSGHENNYAAWGSMVETTKEGITQFKDYTKFDYTYGNRINVIQKEFEAQRDVLVRLTKEVNSEMGNVKLVVNSVSNHHNIFTIAPDLFEVYVKVAEE